MTKFSSEEYEELKGFLRFFSERFFDMEGLDARQRPIAALEQLEKMSAAKASQGLRMAINDCLEMSSRWSAERVRLVDKEMRQGGVVTLSQMRGRYARSYGRIIERGKINSEVEYHLIKGVRDFGGLDLDDKKLAMLERLLQAYEDGVR